MWRTCWQRVGKLYHRIEISQQVGRNPMVLKTSALFVSLKLSQNLDAQVLLLPPLYVELGFG